MSSQGQKEINTIVTGSLNNTKVLVMFGVFGVAFLAGATIKDENFKICFWLSLVLIIICLINLNLAFSFYIKLRNDRGIQGPRGERGDKGPKGFPGRCELNLDGDCTIKNCRAKITDQLMNLCPHYGEIVSKRGVDRTIDENKVLERYNRWTEIINQQCKSKSDEDEFFQEVFKDNSKYCLVGE